MIKKVNKRIYTLGLLIFVNLAIAQTPKGEELLGLEVVPTASIPQISSPIIGSLFFDSTIQKVMMYTTAGWVVVGGSSTDLSFNSTTGALTLTDPKTAGNSIDLKSYVRIAPVKQVTASYTVTAADTGYVIYANSATDMTITLPSGLPVGFNVSVYQQGAGSVTLVGSGAAVYNRLGRNITAGKYAGVGVVQYKANEFVLTGDLRK